MMKYTYTITGEVPSKKNSRILVNSGGRPFSLPGKHYQDWHKDALKQLVAARQPKDPILSAEVEIEIFAGTKRKADLSNKCESVMDLLVDAGILEDDNWFNVGKLSLGFGGVDPKKPRANVTINLV